MLSKKDVAYESDVSGKTFLTIIGEGTEGTGRLSGKGSVRIEGKYEGEIDVEGDVLINHAGQVTANVKASSLTISGVLHGNVLVSGKLDVLSTGTLIGDAKMGSLVIEEGAMLKGHCEIIEASRQAAQAGRSGLVEEISGTEAQIKGTKDK
jgi:cytoskeletal protein CcmA (bactofilin family)